MQVKTSEFVTKNEESWSATRQACSCRKPIVWSTLPQTALCWSCQVTCQQVRILNGWNQDAVFPTEKYSCGYKFCNPRNMNTKYLDLLWWLEIQDFFYCCPVLTAASRWLCVHWFMASSILVLRIIGSRLKTITQIFEWCKHAKITVPELWTQLFQVDETKQPSVSMFLCLLTVRTFFVYSFCSPRHLCNIWEIL